MHVETMAVGALGCNCSIIADLTAKRALVIDPGGDLPEIEKRLHALGVSVEAIVHTHTHLDHVDATAGLQTKTGSRACIHEADRFLYDMLPVQAAMIGIAAPVKGDVEGSLKDGGTIRVGDLEVGILHTPGHTPGSTCFYVQEGDDTRLFAGDTLFKGSIGRTDLWGGDSTAIVKSIHKKLLTLPDETVVITGHGPNTTIGKERISNPFLVRR